ncbi:hypothetical protein BC834DRAFT_966434 [Gloeopeniophorella convolvens]|nr:hypothetical protein BC834DRAFT_966434 [Gloeopeniophorella convolvens]
MRHAALNFLERYCQTFDLARDALAAAYVPDASFSCAARGLRARGRDAVLGALRALGPDVLCCGQRVDYDVSHLGAGVLLVAYGTLESVPGGRRVGYTMAFVLCAPTDGEGETGGAEAAVPWPLVAMAHQMVLRHAF